MLHYRLVPWLCALWLAGAALPVALADEVAPKAEVGIAGSRRTTSDWRLAPDQNAGSTFLTMAQGLAVCLAVLAGGVYAYRRIHPQAAITTKRRMRVRERLPLTSKAQLLLVEIDGREVVVAVGSDHVSIHDARGSQTFDSLLPMDSGCIGDEKLPA